MGHNSTEYIHTVTEALKLALADRDLYYGDPNFARVPAAGLLSEPYTASRRAQIDPLQADNSIRPGDPWKFEPGAHRESPRLRVEHLARGASRLPMRSPATPGAAGPRTLSPDTTNSNVADPKCKLISPSPPSGW